MYFMISLLIFYVISFIISFVLVLDKKAQDKIVSDLSPFSFAEDILIINTRTIFSVKSSGIECIELQYNLKALQNRIYDMRIQLMKTDGSRKNIRYRGSGSGVQPQDMVAALTAHHIKCAVKGIA